eukprot:769896-Pleurochrysis_carterae.AAC.1
MAGPSKAKQIENYGIDLYETALNADCICPNEPHTSHCSAILLKSNTHAVPFFRKSSPVVVSQHFLDLAQTLPARFSFYRLRSTQSTYGKQWGGPAKSTRVIESSRFVSCAGPHTNYRDALYRFHCFRICCDRLERSPATCSKAYAYKCVVAVPANL